MSLRDRIRRIEEKLCAAVAADGKALPVPNIESIFVRIKNPDAPWECREIIDIEDAVSAGVEGIVYTRELGEDWPTFQRRVRAHPRSNPQLPRLISWST